MFGIAANRALAKIGEKVDESLMHRPHEEVRYGQPLPGGRGITDHGGPKREYTLNDEPTETEWDETEDVYAPVAPLLDPVRVTVVSGPGIDRELFRTNSFVSNGTDAISIGAHPTRTKLTITSDKDYTVSDSPASFVPYRAVATAVVTITSTERVYITAPNGAVVSVLEEYTVRIEE